MIRQDAQYPNDKHDSTWEISMAYSRDLAGTACKKAQVAARKGGIDKTRQAL
jgi:hypothetical protein